MNSRGPRRGTRKTQQQRIQSLTSSVNERMNNLHGDRGKWVDICRRTLLDMETRNIHRRARHWTEIVNEKIKDTNSRLALNEHVFGNTITDKFTYKVNQQQMDKHLGFIISWKGLKTRQIQNAPKTYVEFENKAKNWLNGRRAPNYAATLFPDMIKAAEIYADYVSRQIFANNPSHSKMYCKICIIGMLSSLCSARISLNDASKKAYLICENSVKTGKTQVSQILQRYASDHPYPDKFPSHLREASDYFEKKYMELISDFAIKLNQQQRKDKLDYAQTTGKQVLQIINNDSINSHHSDGSNHDSNSIHSNPSLSNNSSHRGSNGSEDGLPASVTHSMLKDITNGNGNLNAISMSIDQFNKLAQFLSGMISNQKTQQNTINDLVQRVQQLETQQSRIMNDVASNSPRSISSPHAPQPQYNTNNSNRSTTPIQQQQQQQNMMQPSMATNSSNNTNISSSAATDTYNVSNAPQQPQSRFVNPLGNNHVNRPNQGRLSPTNSHTTKTTTSTNSMPCNNSMNGMNNMNVNGMANGNVNVNNNGIAMTVRNINNQSMNQMNNTMNNMNHNMSMNPNMSTMNTMNNMNNGYQVSQINNINVNRVNQIQQQMNQMNQMQQQINNQRNQMQRNQMQQQMNMNQMNNYNVNNIMSNTTNTNNTNNATQSVAGAASVNTNISRHLQPTNTLNTVNNGGLPTTSLYGVGSYDSNEGDAAMFGYGNNQSFNSSDAGMNNMMSSMPNTAQQQTNTQQPMTQPIPFDAGFGMPRFSDQSLNLQPTLQSIVGYNQ